MNQAHMDANYGGGFTYSDGAAPPTLAQPAPVNPAAYQPPSAYPSNVVVPQVTPEMMMQLQMQTQVMMQTTLTPQQIVRKSPNPANVKCPFCHVQMTTEMRKETGQRAYIAMCFLTIMCWWCLIPCLWGLLKDTVHSCSSCKQDIGTYIPRRRRRY